MAGTKQKRVDVLNLCLQMFGVGRYGTVLATLWDLLIKGFSDHIPKLLQHKLPGAKRKLVPSPYTQWPAARTRVTKPDSQQGPLPIAHAREYHSVYLTTISTHYCRLPHGQSERKAED